MKKIITASYKQAKKKKSKEYDPNPWAVCTESVGRKNKAKYERCVMDVKKKQKGHEKSAMKKVANIKFPKSEIQKINANLQAAGLDGNKTDFKKPSQILSRIQGVLDQFNLITLDIIMFGDLPEIHYKLDAYPNRNVTKTFRIAKKPQEAFYEGEEIDNTMLHLSYSLLNEDPPRYEAIAYLTT